jgi:zona occludens toxin
VIELITGSPGAGKSFYATRLIVASVLKRRPVATNVPLRPDWSEVLARKWWRTRDREAELADAYRKLVYETDSLADILRVRFRGDGEERADVILDEAHRWLNARAWDQAVGITRDQAIQLRLDVVGYFTAHRHYGVKIYLITQNEANLDNQVRTLYEYVVRLKNVKRLRILGIPVFPVNLFVAVKFWNDKVKTKLGVQTFLLDKKIANLYYTHALAGKDEPDDVVLWPAHG